MTKLVPLLSVCFVLAILSNYYSVYDRTSERYIHKERICFFLLSVISVCFAGLRTSYNDTSTYIMGFEDLETSGIFDGVSWNLGDNPGFCIVRNSIKCLGFSSQFFIFVFALFTIGVELWFVWKYSNNLALSLVLFFLMGCFGLSMAALKQCAAVSICLIAIDRELQKKYIQFFLLVLVALLFHPFAIMFFVVPFMEFRPFGAKSLFTLLVTGILGISMQSWLGSLVNFLALMGTEYDQNLLVGEGVNLFRLTVMWAPVILAITTRKYWISSKEDRVQNLMLNLMVLNAELMFIALFGNPLYFGRLANYFLIFQVIGLTYLMQCFETKSRQIIIFAIVVAYFAYFYYDNVLASTTFDMAYDSVGMVDFLLHMKGF